MNTLIAKIIEFLLKLGASFLIDALKEYFKEKFLDDSEKHNEHPVSDDPDERLKGAKDADTFFNSDIG